MDIQRFTLVGALAIITYVLVLQWNKDYGASTHVPQQASVSSYSTAPDTIPSSVSSAEVPATETGSTLPSGIRATNTGLIRVTTDLLDVLIDPNGGDVIQVALTDYLAQLGSEDKFILLEQNDLRTYTAQSGLTGRDGPDAAGKRPLYSTSSAAYSLEQGADQLQVDLVLTQETGVQITKRFIFNRDDYQIRVEYQVNNASAQPWQGSLFGQIKRDGSDDPSSSTSMGMNSYLGPAFSTQEAAYHKVTFGDLDDGTFDAKTPAGWAAMLQHYFVSAWIPNPEQNHSYFAKKHDSNYFAGFVSPKLELAPGEQGSVSATLYVGPKIQEILETVAPNLELTIDFGWLWWVASPLFWLLKTIQQFVVNWGLSIILVTVVVKALFFPLSAKAYKSMAKMRAVGPQLQRMKEMYGDDRQKMSQAMMELYKKEKINPLGGCLPMLIQMPVFIALYWVLLESVELRQAPFMLWIYDMSVMDPYFVLPILMGVTMFVQQSLNPTPPDPMQAKVMKMLPFVFTFFFLWFPAGLVLYWVVNNLLSITQQWVITRAIEEETNGKKA